MPKKQIKEDDYHLSPGHYSTIPHDEKYHMTQSAKTGQSMQRV
jgi:hypothetical protein